MILECVFKTAGKYLPLFSNFIISLFLNGKAFDFANGAAASSSPTESDDLLYEANHNDSNTIKSRSHSHILGRSNDTGYSVVFKGLVALIALIGVSLMVIKCIRFIQSNKEKKSLRRLSDDTDDCQAGEAAGGAAGGEESPLWPPRSSSEFRGLIHLLRTELLALYNINHTPSVTEQDISNIIRERARAWVEETLDRATLLVHRPPDGTVTPEAQRQVQHQKIEILNTRIGHQLELSNPVLLHFVVEEIIEFMPKLPDEYHDELFILEETLVDMNGTARCDLNDAGRGKILNTLEEKRFLDRTPLDRTVYNFLNIIIPALFRFNNLIHEHAKVIREAMVELNKTDKEIHDDIIRRRGEPQQ